MSEDKSKFQQGEAFVAGYHEGWRVGTSNSRCAPGRPGPGEMFEEWFKTRPTARAEKQTSSERVFVVVTDDGGVQRFTESALLAWLNENENGDGDDRRFFVADDLRSDGWTRKHVQGYFIIEGDLVAPKPKQIAKVQRVMGWTL